MSDLEKMLKVELRDDEAEDYKPKSPGYLEAVAARDQAKIAWCELPPEEQLAKAEIRAFSRRLTREVQDRHAAGWTMAQLEGFVARCRERLRRRLRAERNKSDPPCLRWREKLAASNVGGAISNILEDIWVGSVKSWAMSDPELGYLARPGGPCKCRKCDPIGFENREASGRFVDDFGPMNYPDGAQ
jgi:hypothetical protein